MPPNMDGSVALWQFNLGINYQFFTMFSLKNVTKQSCFLSKSSMLLAK